MGYADYLRALLQPLGVYDLAETSCSGAELAALGGAMDAFADRTALLLRQSLPATADEAGLAVLESLLPPHPNLTALPARREAVLSLMRPHRHTKQSMEQTLRCCGAQIALEEDPGDDSHITATFVGLSHYPPQFGQIDRIVRAVLPVHLQVSYRVDPGAV